MSGLSRDAWAQRLVDDGLMSPEDVHDLLSRLPVGHDLGEELVSKQVITDFQASAVESGELPSLLLGHYIIREKLGSGGMGVVYLARHRHMKRLVALKILSRKLMQDPDAVQRFQREVELLSRLQHPHIAAAYDAGEYRGVHYLVMEFVQGCNLRTMVKREGPLSVLRAVNYIRQAASGMAYVHAQGVIHRDLKPSNLLVNSDDVLKVLDLGLARLVPTAVESDDLTDPDLTEAGAVMGTAAYMAPEQANDTTRADCRSDIYSLGCTLHYVLTGKTLFSGGSTSARMEAHRTVPPLPLASCREGIPPELDRIFLKMVAKDPDARYQSMAQVVEDLEELVDALPAEGAAVSGGFLLNADPPNINTDATTLRAMPTHASRWHWMGIAAALLLSSVAIALSIPPRAAVTPGSGDGATGPLELAADLVYEVPPLVPGDSWTNCVRFAGDDQNIVAGGGIETASSFPVLQRSLSDGSVQKRFVGPTSWVTSLAWAAEGEQLVAATGGSWQVEGGRRRGGDDSSIFVWDYASGKLVTRFREHAGPVRAVALFPDGRTALSAGIDTSIRLWSTTSGMQLSAFENPLSEVFCLAIAPDGKTFATGHWNMVCIWNADDGSWKAQIPARKALALAYSADGTMLGWGDESQLVHLVRLGEITPFLQLSGHQDRITALAWFDDNRLLVSGSDDRTARIWDIPQGRSVTELTGHTAGVKCVAVSQNSQQVLTGGADGTIRLWQLSSVTIP